MSEAKGLAQKNLTGKEVREALKLDREAEKALDAVLKEAFPQSLNSFPRRLLRLAWVLGAHIEGPYLYNGLERSFPLHLRPMLRRSWRDAFARTKPPRTVLRWIRVIAYGAKSNPEAFDEMVAMLKGLLKSANTKARRNAGRHGAANRWTR